MLILVDISNSNTGIDKNIKKDILILDITDIRVAQIPTSY